MQWPTKLGIADPFTPEEAATLVGVLAGAARRLRAGRASATSRRPSRCSRSTPRSPRRTGSSTAPAMHEALAAAGIDLVATPAAGVHAAHIGVTEVPFAGKAAFDVTFAMCGLTADLQHPRLAGDQRALAAATTPGMPVGLQLASLPWQESYCLAAPRSSRPPRSDTARRGRRRARAARARRPSSRASSSGRRARRRAGWQHIALAPPRCDAIAARTASASPAPDASPPSAASPGPAAGSCPGARGLGVAVAAGLLDEVVRVDEHAAVVGRDEARARRARPRPCSTVPPSSSVTTVIALDADTSAAGDAARAPSRPRRPGRARSGRGRGRERRRRAVVAVAEDVQQDADAAVVHTRSCRRCRPRSSSRPAGRRGARSSTPSSRRPARCASPRSGSRAPSRRGHRAEAGDGRALAGRRGQELGAGVQRGDRLDGRARSRRRCPRSPSPARARRRRSGRAPGRRAGAIVVRPEPVQGEEPRVDAGHEPRSGRAGRRPSARPRSPAEASVEWWPVKPSREQHILAPMRAIVGVDVGGTFTDVALIAGGRARRPPRCRRRPRPVARGRRGRRARAGRGGPRAGDVARLGHGTTVATNALLERRGARTALVATAGFADLLTLARQTRPHLYRLEVAPPAPLAEVTAEVDERHRARTASSAGSTRVGRAGGAPAAARGRRGGRRLPAALLRPSPARARGGPPAAPRAARRPRRRVGRRRAGVPRVRAGLDRDRRRLPGPGRRRLPAPPGRSAGRARPARARRDAVERRRVRARRGGRAPGAAAPSGPAGGVAAVVGARAREAVSFDMGGTSTDVCLIRDGEAGRSTAAGGRRPAGARAARRHPHGRRGRRIDRLARRGRRAAGRAAERGRRSGAGRLRPRRRACRPSPTRTSCSAGSTRSVPIAGGLRLDAAAARARAARGRRAVPSRCAPPRRASSPSRTRRWCARSGS